MQKYWFPAKRYGWGWGLPSSWQGWVVFAAFLSLVAAGYFMFLPAQGLAFYIYVVFLVVLLTGICWLKGEPPRWRWGSGKPDVSK
jgi:uncharacterized membrane protein HdeD (DUF308 family)